MKAKGILAAALLLSGAAFAQNASTKTNVTQTIRAENSRLESATDASAAAQATIDPNAVKEVKAQAKSKVKAAAEQAVETKEAVVSGVRENVDVSSSSNAQVNTNTGVNAKVASDVKAPVVENVQLSTNARAKTNVASDIQAPAVKSNLRHSSAIHTNIAPVKVNTRIVGGAGLRIL